MPSNVEFSSRTAFILAAAGSAIGLGNIWGFPVQVASNGGGAFVVVYLLLTFLLAYPVLMAELIIGRYSKTDVVTGLQKLGSKKTYLLASATGYWAVVVASLILSFYAIVAGWMFAYGLQAIALLFGFDVWANWLIEFSTLRNIIFCAIFMLITALIIARGVQAGIERWSRRLMPLLLLLMLLLIAYIALQTGSAQGWRVYLIPDFSSVLNPNLILSALGQAFFSLSLGVGTMMIYGSYVSKQENLPKLGAAVALLDVGIAILAGMLVIPAMYVALHNGVEIFNVDGALIDSDGLIFTVLPALFDSMGAAGNIVSLLFFALMTIAAVTSSISMLEVPVAYAIKRHNMLRKRAAYLTSVLIFLVSIVIINYFPVLFGKVIAFTTVYSQPLLGLLFCLFAGWLWQRNHVLQELRQGMPHAEQSLFWKIWPPYIQYVCPVIILFVFWHTVV